RPLAHPADPRAAVAQRQDDRVVGEAGLDVGGAPELAAPDRQLDHVRVLAALVEVREVLPRDLDVRRRGVDAELLGEPGAYEDGVVPAYLGDRVRALLQPAV